MKLVKFALMLLALCGIGLAYFVHERGMAQDHGVQNGTSVPASVQTQLAPQKPAAERHMHRFGETVEQFFASENGPLVDRKCSHEALRGNPENQCMLVVNDTGTDHTKRFYIFRDGSLSVINLSVFDTPYTTVVRDISARYGPPVKRWYASALNHGEAEGETTLWRVENEHVWATSKTTYHEWDNSTFTYAEVQIVSDAEFHAQGLDDDPHTNF
jgi:hypothetical protein